MTTKPVLDVACGGKMFYFNKDNPNVMFMDIRHEDIIYESEGRKRIHKIRPDIIGDFTDIPFPANTFYQVVFDPPHLLRNVGNSKCAVIYGSLNPNAKAEYTGIQHKKYGGLHADWRDMLRRGFAECFRVLKPNGTLIFKWSEIDIKVNEILALTPYKPLYGNRSGKASKTHWISFIKTGMNYD